MAFSMLYPDFEVLRDPSRCIKCRVCERQCANEVHRYDEDLDMMLSDENSCVNCQRCVMLCPTKAIRICKNDQTFRENSNWKTQTIKEIYRQAESGGVLLSSMGNPEPLPVYWDKILINASQVTNPSIDPLREPMETKVFLGKKPGVIERNPDGTMVTELPPQLELSMPIMFSAMSLGSISYNAHKSLALAATELGTYYNTGEGGLHEDFYQYGQNTIVQVASGRFGVHKGYLEAGSAIEIKMGQGAKPGIGGHLPGKKIVGEISRTRMIPEGSDAISPAPHHDIYSIEDLRQLVYSLKEATHYSKPVIVKVAAVHNIAAIASGIARSGADIIAIDGFRGGTGAAPTRIRDNVGIPIELALASVDSRLRDEGIRNNVSLVVGGSIRSSADVVKAIALGADACYVATAALLAMGCHLCRTCHTDRCNWGIATQRPELVKRLNPDVAYPRLVNLLTAWNREIKEFIGGMGINSIEALRGNRLMLRGVGLNEKELSILGIAHAGEQSMKRVYVNEQWCLGCRLCEYNCAFANSGKRDMATALMGIKIRPNIRVETDGKICFAVSCRHCDEPLCVTNCITGALTRKDGVISINREKCVGCYTCVLSCPYGCITPTEQGVMQKCELCTQNGCTPACVEGCPNKAIDFEER